MKERDQSRLASILTLLVGIWIAISPIWISVTGGALVSVIITGVVIGLMGIIQYFWQNTLPSWISGASSIWLFISTFVFSVGAGAAWSQVLSAIAVFILANWDGAELSELKSRQTHPAM